MKRKTHLSIEECRKIVEAPESKEKSLALLILTAGIHPSCISDWKKYNLQWDDTGITWNRTKTSKLIQLHWRAPLREKKRYKALGYWKRRSRYWQRDSLKIFGESIGIKGLCPLLLRRGYFINHGRLGTSPMDLELESRTRWNTIIDYYAYGKRETGTLNEKDIKLLKWIYKE